MIFVVAYISTQRCLMGRDTRDTLHRCSCAFLNFYLFLLCLKSWLRWGYTDFILSTHKKCYNAVLWYIYNACTHITPKTLIYSTCVEGTGTRVAWWSIVVSWFKPKKTGGMNEVLFIRRNSTSQHYNVEGVHIESRFIWKKIFIQRLCVVVFAFSLSLK